MARMRNPPSRSSGISARRPFSSDDTLTGGAKKKGGKMRKKKRKAFATTIELLTRSERTTIPGFGGQSAWNQCETKKYRARRVEQTSPRFTPFVTNSRLARMHAGKPSPLRKVVNPCGSQRQSFTIRIDQIDQIDQIPISRVACFGVYVFLILYQV